MNYHVFWTYIANFNTHSKGHPFFSTVRADSVRDAIEKAWMCYLDPMIDTDGSFRSKAHFVVTHDGQNGAPWVGKYDDSPEV